MNTIARSHARSSDSRILWLAWVVKLPEVFAHCSCVPFSTESIVSCEENVQTKVQLADGVINDDPQDESNAKSILLWDTVPNHPCLSQMRLRQLHCTFCVSDAIAHLC